MDESRGRQRQRHNSRGNSNSVGKSCAPMDLVRPVMPAQVTRPKEFKFATSSRAHREQASDASKPLKAGTGAGKAPDFAKMLRSYNQKQQVECFLQISHEILLLTFVVWTLGPLFDGSAYEAAAIQLCGR